MCNKKSLSIVLLISLMFVGSVAALHAQPLHGNIKLSKEIESLWNRFTDFSDRGLNFDDSCGLMAVTLKKDISSMLKDVSNHYGYAGYSIIGRKASNDFDEILYRINWGEKMKESILAAMKKEVLIKNASAEAYAKCVDKLSYEKLKQQIYGTIIGIDNIYPGISESEIRFVIPPIKDSAGIDQRRKEIGLNSFHDYLAQIRKEISRRVYIQPENKEN